MTPLDPALIAPAPLAFPSLEVEVFVRMMLATQRLRRGVDAVCERHGITLEQYKVLRFLHHHPGAARCDVTRQCLHDSSPDMTRMLDRLVQRRLVVRTRSPEDGRVSVARLTKAGVTLLEALGPLLLAEMEQALAPLDNAKRRELARLCQALTP